MKYPVSSIWKKFYLEKNARKEIQSCIERGLERRRFSVTGALSKNPLYNGNDSGVEIFFRADDIGVPGRNFFALTSLFSRYEIPLALAVVPTWITRARWEVIEKQTCGKAPLWCWHHHGWRHMNHETTGKKQEFGPSRSWSSLKYDLKQGKQRLKSVLGQDFFPLFTPPWNRCSSQCMELLMELGYKGISRFDNAEPVAPDALPDLQVNVDLHTLKAPDPAMEWKMLMTQLEKGIAMGRCGVMIHHQRMNHHSFDFLELFFQELFNKNLSVSSMSSFVSVAS